MSKKELPTVKDTGWKLSPSGIEYLDAANSDTEHASGVIMTRHQGTDHRIDIRYITEQQLAILGEKNHPFVCKAD